MIKLNKRKEKRVFTPGMERFFRSVGLSENEIDELKKIGLTQSEFIKKKREVVKNDH